MEQSEYCKILFIDCGFTPSQQRDFLNLRFGRKYLDELGPGELSGLIDDLKERKVSPVPSEKDDDWDELTARERARRTK